MSEYCECCLNTTLIALNTFLLIDHRSFLVIIFLSLIARIILCMVIDYIVL